MTDRQNPHRTTVTYPISLNTRTTTGTAEVTDRHNPHRTTVTYPISLNTRTTTGTVEVTDRHNPHRTTVTLLLSTPGQLQVQQRRQTGRTLTEPSSPYFSQHQDNYRYSRGDRQAEPSQNYRHLIMLLLSIPGQQRVQQRRQTGTALSQLPSPGYAVTLSTRTAACTVEATDRYSPLTTTVTWLCCYSQRQDSCVYSRGDRQVQPSHNYRHLVMLLLSAPGQLREQ